MLFLAVSCGSNAKNFSEKRIEIGWQQQSGKEN
jgi:hypothetical protein